LSARFEVSPQCVDCFIGPSLIDAAVFGGHWASAITARNRARRIGVVWRESVPQTIRTHMWGPPLLATPPSRTLCSQQRGKRFGRSQHRGEDQQYDRPRFAYHDVDFGTEVVGVRNSHSGLGNGGSFEFQNRPCVAGSTSCDRGDQPPTVAEPTSLALLGTGIVPLAWFNRRNFAFGGSATAYRAN